MYEPLRRRTLAFLKVPAEPHPPIGDPASLRVFRAGRNYYKLRLASWATAQLLALFAFLFWTAILIEIETQVHDRQVARAAPPATGEGVPASAKPADPTSTPAATNPQSKNWIERLADNIKSAAETVAPADQSKKPQGVRGWVAGYKQFFVELALLLPAWVFPLVWVVKVVSFVIYLVQIPITYAIRRLDFEMRWYMVTDRSLRLRHGVWKVTESTMSFANIQQVVVTHGPLQRLLGLGNVKVQSAGGGSSPHKHENPDDDMHVGMFRHVTNAPEIRDLILERLRHFRESGLGDPEEKSPSPVTPATPSSSDAITAAHELLAEAKALRTALG